MTPAPTNLTLATQYLRLVADFLRGAGVDVGSWLAQHGLDEAQLGDAALTFDLGTFRELLLDAVAVSREPALGLFIGERLVARTHGFMGYAAMHSRTLRQVLEVLRQFVSLRISILGIEHSVEGADLHVRIEEHVPLGDIRRPILEAVVMSVRNTLRAVSMGAFPIQRASFPFPAPDYAELARDQVGCEVRYEQPWAGLTLPAAWLDEPLKMADPRVFEEAARLCQRELDKLEANRTFAGRVRRMLLESSGGFPSLHATSRLLHVTPRTLHRRLQAESTSYRAILDDIRHCLAVEQLRSGVSSIEEIAYTLGYSDPANFRRAFRRWASAPPSDYRNG